MEKNNKNTLLLAVAFVMLSATAQAESQRTAEYDACMDSVDYGALKNSQWAACAEEELARQDVSLNAEYKTLRASLSMEQKDDLLQGQRAWLKYRDSWCRFTEQGNSAPGGIVNYGFCMLDLTDKQIELIKAEQL